MMCVLFYGSQRESRQADTALLWAFLVTTVLYASWAFAGKA